MHEEAVNLAKTGQKWPKTAVLGAVFEKLSSSKSFVSDGLLCKSFVFCATDLKIRFLKCEAKCMERE
jgi:hypothetical protein